MPFCADCDRFYNPNTLTENGDCPDGHHVVDPTEATQDEEPTKVPWHFKFMLIVLVVYLSWRLVQLLMWLWGKVF